MKLAPANVQVPCSHSGASRRSRSSLKRRAKDGQSAASHDVLVAGAEVEAGIADDRLGPEAATARASACRPSPKPLSSARGRRTTRSMRRLRPIKLALRGTPSAVLALLLIAGVAALFLLFVNWLDSWVPGIVSLPTRFWLGLT